MTRVFVSYSHKDEALRAELDKHLSLLRRQGEIDLWSDHRIPAGGDLDASINEALESADIVLLLLSADFISSDYCIGIEMQRAMELHDRGEAIVLPVMLRPCDYQTAPFGRLKAVPTDGKPVTKWPNQDEAFVDIVQHVRRLLKQGDSAKSALNGPRATKTNSSNTGEQAPNKVAGVKRLSNLSVAREFSDQDKHDFAQSTYWYIRDYFDGSLQGLKERNKGIDVRMTEVSKRAFSAVVFRNGKRIAGCSVRFGGGFGGDGIAYSSNENAGDNSFNEHLSIDADTQTLYLKAMMGVHRRGDEGHLSQEGAAEHLWTMLISSLQ